MTCLVMGADYLYALHPVKAPHRRVRRYCFACDCRFPLHGQERPGRGIALGSSGKTDQNLAPQQEEVPYRRENLNLHCSEKE